MGNGLEPGVQVGPMFEAQGARQDRGTGRGRPDQGRQGPHRRRPIDAGSTRDTGSSRP